MFRDGISRERRSRKDELKREESLKKEIPSSVRDISNSIREVLERFKISPRNLSDEAKNWLKDYIENYLKFILAVLKGDKDRENEYSQLVEKKMNDLHSEIGEESILIELNKTLLNIPQLIIEQYLENPENLSKLFLTNP